MPAVRSVDVGRPVLLMGIDLVKRASLEYADLPGSQFKVLNKMCQLALDKPNGKGEIPALYFAGWELLSVALGRKVPSATDPTGRVRRERLRREVNDIRRGLRKARAIETLDENPNTVDNSHGNPVDRLLPDTYP